MRRKSRVNFQTSVYNHLITLCYPHVTVSRLALLRSLGANVDFSNLISALAGSSNLIIFYLLAEGADISSQKKQKISERVN